jgi:hypothetical protein
MMAASGDGAITVASADIYDGHDVRNRQIFAYYSDAVGGADRLRYADENEFKRNPTKWLVVESLGEPPRPEMVDRRNHRFVLKGTYPTGDLSGTTWYLYRLSGGLHRNTE